MIANIQELLASEPFCHYKSDLMDELRKIDVWYQDAGINGHKSYTYTIGPHKFKLNALNTVYWKGDNYLVLRPITLRWFSLLLVEYHEDVLDVYGDNWVEMFSGMDISKRLFVYKHSTNLSFGDLAPDIFNGRPPRYVRVDPGFTAKDCIDSGVDLSQILYIDCYEQPDISSFPNVECIHRIDKQLSTATEYLLQLPQRGIANKR
jgi:hypothetical protein